MYESQIANQNRKNSAYFWFPSLIPFDLFIQQKCQLQAIQKP